MSKIFDRKIQVLKCIVEEYLRTGEVLGSKNLLKKHNLQVSSATIRNDMASLEQMGLIFQPYNSAWRLPTDRGIRVFVDYLMEELPLVFLEEKHSFPVGRQGLIDDVLYGLVSRLTQATREVTFACVPSQGILTYLGFTHLLEGAKVGMGQDVYHIVRFLENKTQVIETLSSLDISPKVSVFIGEEHIGGDLSHSSIIVKKITLGEHTGYLGIIGSIKMDYAYNIATLRQIL